jgi:UDP-N-acetyl-D-mannosaminuronic acid dehydrogenase
MGLGYVGLPTASLLATAGFRVLGVDTDPQVVSALQSARTRLEEHGLSTLVSAAVNSGNLVAASQPQPSGTFVICVPTPVTPDKAVDISAVEAAARAILPCVSKGDLVILESTSPVGTTRNVVGGILRSGGFEPGRDVNLCYCPERVLPGNTVSELINNDRIIGGFTPACAQRALAVYERFCQGRISLTDDLTAEMCKLMENTCRDVNIALANSFARIAEDAGVNVWDAIALANLHPRVKILKPGPGVGGHCIPVDPWFLANAYPGHTALLRAAREINDGQAPHMLARLCATGMLKPGDRLAVLGVAYKADIDDPRESPAALLCRAAAAQNIRTQLHDPRVRSGGHDGLHITHDLAQCLAGAAAAVLLTDHREYQGLSPTVFHDGMDGRLIGDARNVLDHAALRKAGFTVVVLGDGRKN